MSIILAGWALEGLFIALIVVAGLIAFIIVIYLVLTYNSLVSMRNRIENGWAQVDVQLKRRADLIPNLVETVRGYAKHEKSLFENVTKARASMAGAKSMQEKAQASDFLTGALKSLFAVAENYPQLMANQNFQQLQSELSNVEDKIAYSRQFYNDTVLIYNNKVQHFPSRIVASLFGFSEREFFRVQGAEREAVKVKF